MFLSVIQPVASANVQRERSRRAQRSGFTLMEVILASLLATALLAGLWTALKLHMNFFEAGRRRVEAAQLQRGVIGIMQRDLLSTLPPGSGDGEFIVDLPTAISTSEGAATAGTTSAQSVLSPNAPTGDPFAQPSAAAGGLGLPSEALPSIGQSGIGGGSQWGTGGNIGLRGTAHLLELDLATTVDEMRLQALSVTAETEDATYDAAPELCTVVYFLVDANYEMPYTPSETGTAPGGLVRRQFTWAHNQQRPPADEQQATVRPVGGEATADDIELQLIVPESASDDEDLALATSAVNDGSTAPESPRGLIAPEVVALEFRYFDGMAWHSSWDSMQRGSLPSAVEIALAFRSEVMAVAAAQEGGSVGAAPSTEGAASAAMPNRPAGESLSPAVDGERDLAAEYFQGASLFEPPSAEEPWPVTRLIVRLPASGLQPTGEPVDAEAESGRSLDWQEPVDLWERTGPAELPTSPVLTDGVAPSGSSPSRSRAGGPATVAP